MAAPRPSLNESRIEVEGLDHVTLERIEQLSGDEHATTVALRRANLSFAIGTKQFQMLILSRS